MLCGERKNKMNYYTVTKINDNIYQFNDKLSVLSTLVIGKDKALLFDTTYGIGNLKEEVEKVTTKPLVVVNSHGHMDHACGNFQFNEVYIDKEDLDLIQSHTNENYRQRNLESAKQRGVLPNQFDEESYLKERTGKLVLLNENHIFDLGDLTLEVVKIPGHTKGSIALFIKELKIMLVSDGACPYVWMFLNESATLNDYLNSLNKLLEYDFESFLLGHGAGLMERKFMYRLKAITEEVLSGNVDDKFEEYIAPGFEIEGTVSYCEGRPYEAGKCGIIFNKYKITK